MTSSSATASETSSVTPISRVSASDRPPSVQTRRRLQAFRLVAQLAPDELELLLIVMDAPLGRRPGMTIQRAFARIGREISGNYARVLSWRLKRDLRRLAPAQIFLLVQFLGPSERYFRFSCSDPECGAWVVVLPREGQKAPTSLAERPCPYGHKKAGRQKRGLRPIERLRLEILRSASRETINAYKRVARFAALRSAG